MSKADNDTVMEAVDTEVSVTCVDLGLVRKTFQLALLCTKRHPSDRPTMHEVSRVLVSLLPAPRPKPSSVPSKSADYVHVVGGDLVDDKSGGKPDDVQYHYSSSSDGPWFVKFGEVISKTSV
ncbi:hypothetical protein HPP92_002922 [Vanilla planifolia]|nr:hypothetical protein HPP92_002922 [Vanilla planifolia]